MQKKLIDLHKEWCETGKLPKGGLCNSLPWEYIKAFSLFDYDQPYGEFWGCPEYEYGDSRREFEYTPTRQTIVLLICAMNNEY